MPKWVFWALLEVSTIMVFVSVFLVWRGKRLRADPPENDTEAQVESDLSHQISPDASQDDLALKRLAAYLDKQVTFAAERLKALRPVDDLTQVTRFKIWGTLIKAERAIILNEAGSKPRSILNRFMASILNVLSSSSGMSTNKAVLEASIRDVDEEFKQAGALLLSKEELVNNQKLLHKDITTNIDRATKRINQIRVKEKELERLLLELDKLHKQNERLQELSDTEHPIPSQPQRKSKEARVKHESHKHLVSLQHLADRQQTVIEQLQSQIAKERDDKEDRSKDGQDIALQRMERLVNESKSLIGQLNNELTSTNFTIESLKTDIDARDNRLKELEKKLKNTKTTAIGQLEQVSSEKKDTLSAFMGDISDAKANSSTSNEIYEEQEKEAIVLERLLQESETCVQLLAQELEFAEKDNIALQKQVDEKQARHDLEASVTRSMSTHNEQAQLKQLRQRNRQLVEMTTNLKNQLVDVATNNSEKKLRGEYNRKSLELDRLQLAYSDLERKYLGTLS